MFPVTCLLMFCILQLFSECFLYCSSFNNVPTWLNCIKITVIWQQLYVLMTELLGLLSLNSLKKLFSFYHFVIFAHVIACKPFLNVSFSQCHSLFIKNRMIQDVVCDCYAARWTIGCTHFLKQLGKRFRVHFIVIITIRFFFSFIFISFYYILSFSQKKPSTFSVNNAYNAH
jgi:hypothetical protein